MRAVVVVEEDVEEVDVVAAEAVVDVVTDLPVIVTDHVKIVEIVETAEMEVPDLTVDQDPEVAVAVGARRNSAWTRKPFPLWDRF